MGHRYQSFIKSNGGQCPEYSRRQGGLPSKASRVRPQLPDKCACGKAAIGDEPEASVPDRIRAGLHGFGHRGFLTHQQQTVAGPAGGQDTHPGDGCGTWPGSQVGYLRQAGRIR